MLTLIPSFRHFNRNGHEAELKSYKEIPDAHEPWALQLIEDHMKDIYEASGGWDEEAKEGELYDSTSRFIFAFTQDKPIGFIMFNFDIDGTETSAFILDVHVDQAFRHKGLGRFLVQCVEFIALKSKLDAVLLSLYKENIQGRKFFRAMRYTPHKSSPINTDREAEYEYEYEVLFKPLLKPSPPK